MNRLFGLVAVLALVVGVTVTGVRGADDDDKDKKKKEDKVLSIKSIMGKAHRGADSCRRDPASDSRPPGPWRAMIGSIPGRVVRRTCVPRRSMPVARSMTGSGINTVELAGLGGCQGVC